MPELTKNGRTITVRESQAVIYRANGWVDVEGPRPSMSMSKNELADLAVAAGWDPGAAEAATKQEIVDSLT